MRFLKPSFDSQLEILDMYSTGRDNQLMFLSILTVLPWKIFFFCVDTISKMLAWNILIANQNLDWKKKKKWVGNFWQWLSEGSHSVYLHPCVIFLAVFSGSFTSLFQLILICQGHIYASNWSNSKVSNLLSFHRENQEDQAEMETVEFLDYRYEKAPSNSDNLMIGFVFPFCISQVNMILNEHWFVPFIQ